MMTKENNVKIINENDSKKINAIERLLNGETTIKETMFELNKSRQQIYLLRKQYKNYGKEGLIHKGRGKPSKFKISRKIIDEIENLYLNEYYDYNFQAFYEELTEKEKYKGKYEISYSTLYNMFLNDDIISPNAHKETIRLYNEKMNNAINEKKNITEEKIELYQSRQISFEKAHIRRSSNQYAFGQEIQMDASPKIWFGDVITHLHLAVDKGTKKVLFGWFEYEEITRAYFILLYNIIINYGIPKRIKTDNRTTFSNQENKVDTTQFGRICIELGIELITTSVATAKANVERENRTFKDRLIAELRHEGITDIDEANKYLNEVFIPKMNKKFSYEIEEKNSMMKKNNYSEEELNLIISERTVRIIDNASSIKYNGKYYIPIDNNTGEIVSYIKKTECIVIMTYNAKLWCKIENNFYLLVEIESRDTTMIKETDNNKSIKKKKIVPPKNHPWRKNMMLRH